MSQNISISVRIRPQNKREKDQQCIVKMVQNKIILKCSLVNRLQQDGSFQQMLRQTFNQSENQDKQFEFTKCYWSYDNVQNKFIKNIDVYNDLGEQLVKNVFDGYNSTIFAYGQTGSGKSYSIEGQDGVEKGILQHSIIDIFKKKEENKNIDTKVLVSYLEIYNEDLRDLLDPRKKQIKIFSTNEGVIVQNLAKINCENLEDIMKLLQEGKKIRVVGSHAMNIKSSRSHAVFIIFIIQKEGSKVKTAKLNIVDLAGSERYSKTLSNDVRMQEASNINKSLTFLGLVIENLAKNQTQGQNLHVPYRNSNLTHLLSESLCGNSKTFMIATISGAEENYEETLSTLRFAERVQCIKTNSKQNISDEEMKQQQSLQQEIEQMKKEIQNFQRNANMTSNKLLTDEQQIQELYEKKSALEEELQRNEMMLLDATKSLEFERQQKQLLEQQRIQILQEAGVLIAGNEQIIGVDKNTPYLINMSDDPSMSGCLVFYLKNGENTFGMNKQCDIHVNGLGIRKLHCIFNNSENTKITLKILEDARVQVNGMVQDFDQNKKTNVIQLNHLDRFLLGKCIKFKGHQNAYKLIIPKLNKNNSINNDNQNLLEDFMKGRLSQTDEQSKNLKKLIEEVKSKVNPQSFNRFLDQIQTALDNIDKANEITLFRYRKFPLKSHNLLFSLEILINVLSFQTMNLEFAVSVKNRDSDEIEFIWKYARFTDRLDDMMQWYSHENRGDDKYNDDYNPWQDSNYTRDLNKMSTKELYRHWYAKQKQESLNIENHLKEKDLLIKQILKLCQQQGHIINEENIEQYADVFYRGFDSNVKDSKIENMKKIQNINYYIKVYMEICAEIINCQMQKNEAQQKLEKILLTHKKTSKNNAQNNNLSENQDGSQQQLTSLNITQNTLYSLQIQQNSGLIQVKNSQRNIQQEQYEQQYLYQQKLIPQQLQLIQQLNQTNQKLKDQINQLMDQ